MCVCALEDRVRIAPQLFHVFPTNLAFLPAKLFRVPYAYASYSYGCGTYQLHRRAEILSISVEHLKSCAQQTNAIQESDIINTSNSHVHEMCSAQMFFRFKYMCENRHDTRTNPRSQVRGGCQVDVEVFRSEEVKNNRKKGSEYLCWNNISRIGG